ncbi:hypothetical protein UlMin_013408 [Ulmus minor]
MPPSALHRLATLRIDYPMLFELNNPANGRVSNCGVLEFVADEGMIYLPQWMMKNMVLEEGDIVKVKSTSLEKGTYVKLQPHTSDFLDISNPKAILEITLRNYSCLTTGDTIMVSYNNKNYYINIVETKPSWGISIIETDCEVDFAAPLDYKEPEKPAPSASSDKKTREAEEDPTSKVPKFNPFTGPSRRLDGKGSAQLAPPASSPMLKQHQPEGENGRAVSKSSTTGQASGKLIFGSRQPQNETPKVGMKNNNQEAPQKVEEPLFQAFTGKKYSLRG